MVIPARALEPSQRKKFAEIPRSIYMAGCSVITNNFTEVNWLKLVKCADNLFGIVKA